MKLFYLRRKEFSNVLMFNLFFLPEEEIRFFLYSMNFSSTMNFPRRNSPQFRIPLVTIFDSNRFATALNKHLWKCYDEVAFISFQTDF